MSTRQNFRPHRRIGGPRKSPLGGASFALSGLSWREVQPLLLRSAGVVGLAGVLVAAISSDGLFGGPEAERLRPQAAVLQEQDAADAQASVETVRVPATAELLGPATGVFEPNPELEAPATEIAALPGPPPPPAEPAAAEAPPMAAPPPPPLAPAEAAAAAAPSPLLADTADCPRDWVAVNGTALPGDAAAECAAAPALEELAAVESDLDALDAAAMERAAEAAGLEFAPRIPKARPDPPPPPRKSARRTARANWPSGPPPDCGKKYARWRYVNKVPTWYCR